MTTATKYIDPSEPTYEWNGWDENTARADFKPDRGGEDFLLMTIAGIACSYDVWAVGYMNGGHPSRIVVTIGDEIGGHGGGILREWTVPNFENWDHNYAWIDTLITLGMRWAFEHAILEIRKEGLAYPTTSAEALSGGTSDGRLIL